MIKLIILCTKAIVVAIVALLFASCNGNFNIGVKGNGKVKSETRKITEKFTKIEANDGLNVTIEQSNTTQIVVEADENLLKLIETKVENGVLVMSTKKQIGNYEKLTISVKMPIIESLTSESGSSLKTINTIKGTKIQLESSSGSNLNATISYDVVEATSSSGSQLNIEGIALKLETSSDSGSDLNAEKLTANEVVSNADSGSETKVNPKVSLKADANSGGSILYKNEPKSINKTEDSGGSISKQD